MDCGVRVILSRRVSEVGDNARLVEQRASAVEVSLTFPAQGTVLDSTQERMESRHETDETRLARLR